MLLYFHPMQITAAFVVFMVEVLIEDKGKRWRGTLREESGRGYVHCFELTVHGKVLGDLVKKQRSYPWQFIIRNGTREDLAEQLGAIADQYLPLKPVIKLR